MFLGLSFLAGLVSALGFAPVGLWPLAILAVAFLLWLVERAPTLRSALARGWWFGFGHFVLGLNWIATAFTYQAAMPAWLGWLAVVLLSLYLAIFPAAAAGLAWRYGRSAPLVFTLLFASAWIVTEWLRAGLFTGFPWNPLAVVLVGRSIAPLAAWIGTYGLSAIVVLFAGLLWIAVAGPNRRPALVLAFAALLAQVGAAFAVRVPEAGEGPRARIVQPDIGQQNKWDPGFEAQNFRRLQRLTGRPGPGPRLVFWPEAAVPDYLSIEPAARRRIASLIGPRDLILTGGVERIEGADGRAVAAHNSLYVIDPLGRILGRYDKAHLVPYGEYLPMRPILSPLGLSRLAPGALDFWAGPGPRTLELPGFGSAGIQICYEIIFSGNVVDAANRPDFIFNPSNDAWFGAWGPPQHLAQARLRAIEEGLPVVRATPTGISAVIDASGRVLDAIPLGEAGAIDVRLPPPAPPTPFARFGNALPFLFALLLAAAAIAVRRKAGAIADAPEGR